LDYLKAHIKSQAVFTHYMLMSNHHQHSCALKLLWCDITSFSKCSPPFQRSLLPSCTTNR